MPGAINGFELAPRAILGQQVTVKAATTIAGRLAAGRMLSRKRISRCAIISEALLPNARKRCPRPGDPGAATPCCIFGEWEIPTILRSPFQPLKANANASPDVNDIEIGNLISRICLLRRHQRSESWTRLEPARALPPRNRHSAYDRCRGPSGGAEKRPAAGQQF